MVGRKTAPSTVSKQIVLRCVPIKLVLSNLNVIRIVFHRHTILRLLLNILSVIYIMHGVIVDAQLRHWYNQ